MNQEQVWDILAESWNNFRQKAYEKDLYDLDWKKGRLLDVGCGNCRNLLLFKNLELYGIDFSSKMLEQAKKFCDKNNLKVNLRKADMTKIPSNDNYFDYCLCLASLHHLNKENMNKETFCNGPYRYTRIPTHFGLFFLMLDFGVIVNSLFIVILSVISFIIIKLTFIKKEEKILTEKYGTPYLEYKNSVKF